MNRSEGWLWIACVSIVNNADHAGLSPFYRGFMPDLSTGLLCSQSDFQEVFHQFTGPSNASISLIYYN